MRERTTATLIEALEIIQTEIDTCNGHLNKEAQEQHAYNILCRVRLLNGLFKTNYSVVRNASNDIELIRH